MSGAHRAWEGVVILSERLLIDGKVRVVSGASTAQEMISYIATNGNWDECDKILLTTGQLGAGSQFVEAALTLQQRGVRSVVAPAFSWEFVRVCINIGLPPLTVWEAREVQSGDRLRIDVESRVVKAMTSGTRYPIRELPDLHADILSYGGMQQYVLSRLETRNGTQ